MKTFETRYGDYFGTGPCAVYVEKDTGEVFRPNDVHALPETFVIETQYGAASQYRWDGSKHVIYDWASHLGKWMQSIWSD